MPPTFALPSRRAVLAGAGAGLIAIRTAAAETPGAVAAAIREAFGDVKVTPGRVALDLPSLAENGHSVPMTVTVESPMTAADHVTRIFLFSEKNPSTNVVRFHLGPRSGRARVQTNIRLADTQKITAVAQMQDGSCWSGTASTIVTVAACLEDS
jgi:sulfur-oxidizing protein SoxY